MRLTKDFDSMRTLQRYLLFMALGNLVWEFVQMPLYTIWQTGSAAEIAYAAIHCTAGDLLIATTTFLASIFAFGNRQWPKLRNLPVAGSTIISGLCYTVFSEWLNIDVRAAWAYNDLMPVIPVLDVGLSPFSQWIVLPILAFWFAGSKRSA
jgi:hypothetical protein